MTSIRELEREEQPEPLVSARRFIRVTLALDSPGVCRFSNSIAHEMERRGGGAAPHHLPVSGQVDPARLLAVRPDRVQEDEADRLLLGATARPGDSR